MGSLSATEIETRRTQEKLQSSGCARIGKSMVEGLRVPAEGDLSDHNSLICKRFGTSLPERP